MSTDKVWTGTSQRMDVNHGQAESAITQRLRLCWYISQFAPIRVPIEEFYATTDRDESIEPSTKNQWRIVSYQP